MIETSKVASCCVRLGTGVVVGFAKVCFVAPCLHGLLGLHGVSFCLALCLGRRSSGFLGLESAVFDRLASFVAVLFLSLRGLVCWQSRTVSAWGGSVRPSCWVSEGPVVFGRGEPFDAPLVSSRALWLLVVRGY